MSDDLQKLKNAIDSNDLEGVITLMSASPALHQAPLGYNNNGPLTWVAECRVPWEPPGPVRLAMAKWMLDNGSDVHQGGDGPLARAALYGDRIAMMELLVEHGADVNALWNGNFPIIFAPCETVDPVALRWLLDHGANPNTLLITQPNTSLDYVIGSYVRSPDLALCIDILLSAGGTTRYSAPPVLDILRGRVPSAAQPDQRYPELDCGTTAARMLTLQGATLLHVAAEYGNLAAARHLLDHGADVNARATIDANGVGGQTALFHAATQNDDAGLPIVKLLLERGADVTVLAKLPGHYERPGEVVECTPLTYAMLFPGNPDESQTVALLRKPRPASR